MFKNIRSKIVALLSVAFILAPFAVPVMASAAAPVTVDVNSGLCQGASLDLSTPTQTCDKTTSGGTAKVNNIIHTVINVFSLVVGIVSVIMIIVGGFRYVTSGGSGDAVSGAKNTIVYAIIGLVVVALAQFIVQFVLNKVTTS